MLREQVDLTGFVDMHVHTGPDVRPRSVDDLAATRDAAAAGMAGLLLKSHVTLTADRAAIAEKVVGGVRVFGGLALNREVGGLNPAAVEVALQLGAREIFLPTFSARGKTGDPRGLVVADDSGRLLPAVLEILELVGKADAVLGTGHLSVAEIVAVAREAPRRGVRKVLITHPDSHIIAMPLAVQRDLAGMGVWFERCYQDTLGPTPFVGLPELARRIRATGPAVTVLSTDLGQVGNPRPVEGFRAYAAGLLAEGFAPDEIRRMAATNPAGLLGL